MCGGLNPGLARPNSKMKDVNSRLSSDRVGSNEAHRRFNQMKRCILYFIVAAACAVANFSTMAQAPVNEEVQLLPPSELDRLLGPIALYPDPLLAQLLPAATLPSEVVMADRYLQAGGDPNQVDMQPWDPSVKAMARFPAILKWMDDNLGWTTQLGQAFLYQQQDVMDAVQRLRNEAMALGNLQSTPEETVVNDGGYIEILPTNPEVVYVPVYQPDMIYSERTYGAPLISFNIGLPIGVWFNHDFDWRAHHVVVWSHNHPRPSDWWMHRPADRAHMNYNPAHIWQPRQRDQARATGGLDRGWNRPQPHYAAPAAPAARPAERRGGEPPRAAERPRTQPQAPRAEAPAHRPEAPAARPAPVPQRPSAPAPERPAAPVRPAPAPRAPAMPARSTPATGAFIGVQSSRQTQEFSNRGQQSRQEISRPAPAPAPARSAPAPAPSHSEPRPSGNGRTR